MLKYPTISDIKVYTTYFVSVNEGKHESTEVL